MIVNYYNKQVCLNVFWKYCLFYKNKLNFFILFNLVEQIRSVAEHINETKKADDGRRVKKKQTKLNNQNYILLFNCFELK